ncbi:HAD family hydrolase [Aquimarina intermedia]|uniref:Putative hydrolase of the HAD superfamily n=1 Tax=Aquimarina intermedia TaxID=350814 RepID=A0A5S5C2T8_9FLAO|nr:HAD family phosphatase [Aquimarina intermedia]TYP72283.1 putative hydrolase of the HAD superfamily [Aquimarina intermedia]
MIRTILFDFGDVFINLNKEATQNEFIKLDVSHLTDHLDEVNTLFETGKINSKVFLNEYQNILKQETTDSIVHAWNAILLDFPQHRFNFILELHKSQNYQLILLSNTNALHIEWIQKNVHFYEAFKNCFDHFYLSHEIQLRKPNPEIYEFVLTTHNLKADEVLFIDDTKDNTDAAKALGIHVWNIAPKTEDIVDLFTIKAELF